MQTAEFWIRKLQLQPHPEGGYYQEVYRSPERLDTIALPARFSGDRSFGTSIYFLLRSQDVSHFHRLQSDEIWHFYTGVSLTLHLLNKAFEYQKYILGQDVDAGEHLQICVPRQTWFGATVNDVNSYTLVGCTTAPGFDVDDFELADRKSLLEQFPEYRTIIERLTTVNSRQ